MTLIISRYPCICQRACMLASLSASPYTCLLFVCLPVYLFACLLSPSHAFLLTLSYHISSLFSLIPLRFPFSPSHPLLFFPTLAFISSSTCFLSPYFLLSYPRPRLLFLSILFFISFLLIFSFFSLIRIPSPIYFYFLSSSLSLLHWTTPFSYFLHLPSYSMSLLLLFSPFSFLPFSLSSQFYCSPAPPPLHSFSFHQLPVPHYLLAFIIHPSSHTRFLHLHPHLPTFVTPSFALPLFPPPPPPSHCPHPRLHHPQCPQPQCPQPILFKRFSLSRDPHPSLTLPLLPPLPLTHPSPSFSPTFTHSMPPPPPIHTSPTLPLP